MGYFEPEVMETWAERAKLFDLTVTMLDGSEIKVSELCKEAKVVCFATMASEDDSSTGYTPSYMSAVESEKSEPSVPRLKTGEMKIAELEALHRAHYPELVVIGTPTNNYINRETGTDEEVQ